MITGQEVFISSYFIILHRLQGGAVSSAAASAAISTALTLVEQKREQQIDIIEGWNHRCIMWTRHNLLISNVHNLCHCILEWGLPTSQQDVLAWQKFYDVGVPFTKRTSRLEDEEDHSWHPRWQCRMPDGHGSQWLSNGIKWASYFKDLRGITRVLFRTFAVAKRLERRERHWIRLLYMAP